MVRLSLSEFADKVNELMPVIIRTFLKQQSTEFYKIKLTMPQFVILDILQRHGESKMSDLAKSLSVTTAAMTGIVDRLVREGYLRRESDPKDRRIIKIRLTAKGERAVTQILEKKKQMIIKMFGMISQGEREEYLRILTHIRDHLKD